MVPEISVVMSVYNGGRALRETVESILNQNDVDLEFIIVDDGSIDGTGEILCEYAEADSRVRVLTQENAGLTQSLIRGCSVARGRYIARQDCGDASMPGRLAKQRDLMDSIPGAVMASCGTKFVGPQHEPLYSIVLSTEDLQAGLRQLELEKIRGPSHHGSTIFCRQAYEQAGGYRANFRVAQDLDLWMRLAELGQCVADESILYQAQLTPGGISSKRRDEQIETAKKILACARARRMNQDESQIMSASSKESSVLADKRHVVVGSKSQAIEDARFYYFIACTLLPSDPGRSRHYFWRAIRCRANYLHAWVGLIRSALAW